LRHKGEAEAGPGPYGEVLRRLGERHERAHLAIFPTVVDLSVVPWQDREQKTKDAVNTGTPVVYQGVLRTITSLVNLECEVIGVPDFLINEDGQYVIRDSKISRRITEKDHPEILRQLELYAWLFEKTFGQRPLRLEIHIGTGCIVEIPYDGGDKVLKSLSEILQVKQWESEPYNPVGWTKCGGCGFYSRCWPRAERDRDVALVSGVDQGLARALHGDGIRTAGELLSHFDQTRLADYQRPRGKGLQRVGRRAEEILRNAEAFDSGKEIILQPPSLPTHSNYVIFDLEGMPPQLDELEKVYLWGIQVYGDRPGSYQAGVAGFGIDGERKGWEAFLEKAGRVLEEYGDLPFVHWHHYERVRLDMYVDRFGDPNGIGARIRRNLLDLLPITQRAIALPVASYSLKVIEKFVGFRRALAEANGEWAMAKYIEATETQDANQRAAVMAEILAYNQEDLEATWAVMKWLKEKII
jgi:predicted RecB family nuclease